jgi:uncharacterized protein YbjT (DUF2867 family)
LFFLASCFVLALTRRAPLTRALFDFVFGIVFFVFVFVFTQGVEIVQANQHSAEDIAKANAGAYGVFAVTNFWDPESMGQEVDLGRALIKGAVDAGVKHCCVWILFMILFFRYLFLGKHRL